MSQSTVVSVMNGHPRDQAKVSVYCRWSLIRVTDVHVEMSRDIVTWPTQQVAARERGFVLVHECPIHIDVEFFYQIPKCGYHYKSNYQCKLGQGQMSLNTINNTVFPVVGRQSEYYLNNASFILHNMDTFEKLII